VVSAGLEREQQGPKRRRSEPGPRGTRVSMASGGLMANVRVTTAVQHQRPPRKHTRSDEDVVGLGHAASRKCRQLKAIEPKGTP
jgi:hypothetical protein